MAKSVSIVIFKAALVAFPIIGNIYAFICLIMMGWVFDSLQQHHFSWLYMHHTMDRF
jgi:hypothetical protein